MRFIIFLFSIILLGACSRAYDYNCENTSINPVFVNFQLSDIDSLVLRKFTANSNFVNQLDSVLIVNGYSGYYTTSHDSTLVRMNSEKISISKGYDYQLFIPAQNRVINITDIVSEIRSETCHPVAKVACKCYNRFFSLKSIQGITFVVITIFAFLRPFAFIFIPAARCVVSPLSTMFAFSFELPSSVECFVIGFHTRIIVVFLTSHTLKSEIQLVT